MSIQDSTDTKASPTKTPPLHAPTPLWHGDVIEIDDNGRSGPVVRQPYRPDTEPISSSESTDKPDDVSVSAAWPRRRDIAAVDLVLTM